MFVSEPNTPHPRSGRAQGGRPASGWSRGAAGGTRCTWPAGRSRRQERLQRRCRSLSSARACPALWSAFMASASCAGVGTRRHCQTSLGLGRPCKPLRRLAKLPISSSKSCLRSRAGPWTKQQHLELEAVRATAPARCPKSRARRGRAPQAPGPAIAFPSSKRSSPRLCVGQAGEVSRAGASHRPAGASAAPSARQERQPRPS